MGGLQLLGASYCFIAGKMMRSGSVPDDIFTSVDASTVHDMVGVSVQEVGVSVHVVGVSVHVVGVSVQEVGVSVHVVGVSVHMVGVQAGLVSSMFLL